jgi:hypothetical protein
MADEDNDRAHEIRHHLEDGDYEAAGELVDTASARERLNTCVPGTPCAVEL